MAKFSTLVGILLVLASCGGGGSATLVGVMPPPTEQLVVQQMFEGCGVQALSDWRQVVDQPIALLEDASPIPPSMFITTVSTMDAYFIWQTNLDLDVPIDLEVKTEFQDALGQPMLPVPQAEFVAALNGDLSTLSTFLVAMPAGSRVVHTITTPKAQPGEPVINATVTHTIGAGGVLAGSAGTYNGDDGTGCITTLAWTGLGLPTPAFQNPPITGTLDIQVAVGASDVLNGSLTYAPVGSSELRLGLNAGLTYGYDFDPVGGTLAPNP